jgi:hypothetical protein
VAMKVVRAIGHSQGHKQTLNPPEARCRAQFPPQTAKRWPGFCHKPRNQSLCGEIRLKQASGRC